MWTLIVVLVVGFIAVKLWERHLSRKSIDSLLKTALELETQRQSKPESQGVRYIPSDPANGISQMMDFPYKSFEEWMSEFRKAATDTNPLLKISMAADEELWVIDLLEDGPSRRAFNDHLNPIVYGNAFGKQFTEKKFIALMQEGVRLLQANGLEGTLGSVECEKEVLQDEALVKAVEAGFPVDHALKASEAIGKLYDLKKSRH